jgi:hypothetical protein
VKELNHSNKAASNLLAPIHPKLEDIFQHEKSRVPSPLAGFVESRNTNVKPCESFETFPIEPRLSDSRGSVSVRIPTAEKSDTASMMIVFTPQPPPANRCNTISPRVVVQKELLNDFPLSSKSPLQYIPQKLVARGRFKSTPIAYPPKQQQQPSHITLSLLDTSSALKVPEIKSVVKVPSNWSNTSEFPLPLVKMRSKCNQSSAG